MLSLTAETMDFGSVFALDISNMMTTEALAGPLSVPEPNPNDISVIFYFGLFIYLFCCLIYTKKLFDWSENKNFVEFSSYPVMGAPLSRMGNIIVLLSAFDYYPHVSTYFVIVN